MELAGSEGWARGGWHRSRAHSIRLFEASTGSEKRGDLRAGLVLALEVHENSIFQVLLQKT